jgi:rRNA processing protein Krr1/Pno1
MAKTVFEKLQTAIENVRIGPTTIELLGELSDVREWAEALNELADNIESAEGAVQDYIDTVDRDEKADAKETAIDALNELVESWGAVTALPDVDDLVKAP